MRRSRDAGFGHAVRFNVRTRAPVGCHSMINRHRDAAKRSNMEQKSGEVEESGVHTQASIDGRKVVEWLRSASKSLCCLALYCKG